MRLQRVINISWNACVEILSRLLWFPAQLPTTFAPRTRIGSHIQESELVRLRIQVRFAQLSRLRGHHFPAGIESLGDHPDNSQLVVLPALKKIESVATGSWLFSGHYRVEEDVIELSDLTCISNTSIGTQLREMKNLRTFIDMHVWPHVLALTNIDGSAQLDGQLDSAGDLLGVGLLETFLDKDGVGKTPNRGREDNPGLRVSCVGLRLIV